jgi:hypothetical protein
MPTPRVCVCPVTDNVGTRQLFAHVPDCSGATGATVSFALDFATGHI